MKWASRTLLRLAIVLTIDVDDLLDFLARDSKTSAILLYLEHLAMPGVLSPPPVAPRNKPILVIKSGLAAARRRRNTACNSGMIRLGCRYSAAGGLRAGHPRAFPRSFAVENPEPYAPIARRKATIISNGAAPAALALDELWLRGNASSPIFSEATRPAQAGADLGVEVANLWIYAMTPAASTISRR